MQKWRSLPAEMKTDIGPYAQRCSPYREGRLLREGHVPVPAAPRQSTRPSPCWISLLSLLGEAIARWYQHSKVAARPNRELLLSTAHAPGRTCCGYASAPSRPRARSHVRRSLKQARRVHAPSLPICPGTERVVLFEQLNTDSVQRLKALQQKLIVRRL